MKNKQIPTSWFVALIVASLFGLLMSRNMLRIIATDFEALGRWLGEFIGLRPSGHITIYEADVIALKYWFLITFTVLVSNWFMRWWLESIESVREFAKKMYKWVSKPLLFWSFFGILLPYGIDLLQKLIGGLVWACTGKVAVSWRLAVPALEHRFHFSLDAIWNTFWVWLDGPLSPTTQHFGQELLRQL